MLAGAAKTDITPTTTVWMDGMIRAHKSEGVHDPLFARALVLSPSRDLGMAILVVSLDVVAITTEDAIRIRTKIAQSVGIPTNHICLAATHTHSAPATVGYFNPKEVDYVAQLEGSLVCLAAAAVHNLRPAAIGYGSGKEETISQHRRLLTHDGRVVMNWEHHGAGTIARRLGAVDPEVGVLKVVTAGSSADCLCTIFNHAGHPNVMSGDNYLISADYPGVATRLVEDRCGGIAMFLNGAQGSVDVDGFTGRDWNGVARSGTALADAVSMIAKKIVPRPDVQLRVKSRRYSIPARLITEEELQWASQVLAVTGGAVTPMADGVGDDYKALLYRQLSDDKRKDFEIEQVAFAVNSCAFISFPGELYAEHGLQIKARSPFQRTYITGLANGDVGYVPTRQAILEGGYAEDTRLVDESAGEIVVEQSCALLHEMHDRLEEQG